MRIKVNNANSPVWRELYTQAQLPKELSPLLKWRIIFLVGWNYECTSLFKKIDEPLWKETCGNPVLLYKKFHANGLKRL
jgi:starch phosphorylase